MSTTQMNPETAVPQSAQQRNGAARTPEQQRSAAGIPQSAPQPEKIRQDAVTERRRPAAPPREGTQPAPRQRQQAPQRKQTAAPQKKRQAAKTAEAPSVKNTAAKRTETKPQQKAAKTRKAPEKKKAPKLTLFAPKKQQKKEEPEQTYTKGLPDSVSTKKRAYGNSKPKKKTALDMVNDAVKRSGEKKAEKIKARHAQMEKGPQKKVSQKVDAPAVIYTEPAAFNRSRFAVQMATVLAIVIALVMCLSVFFKVGDITVSGAEVYSAWAVRDASGIKEGDNLLTFSHARAGALIKANLPYVKSVRFGIKLPDTVNIMIEEEPVVYAIKTQDGTWWLMNSDGRMVEQSNTAKASKYTQILGVTVTDPVSNERGIATESAAVYETDASGETVPVPVSVTGAQRLSAALQILQSLEANDIVGDAASVDVTRLEDIILWYGTRFQVNLGDTTNLSYKVDCMNDVILQMSEYQTGILDISFTIWPNQVGFTPFS